MQNNLDFESAKSSSVFDRYLWFDPGLTLSQQNSKPPRLIKSHLQIKFLPKNLIESKAKVRNLFYFIFQIEVCDYYLTNIR